MADLMATGLAWLADQLVAHVSAEVTYRRGADSVVLQAVLGSKLLRTHDRQGNVKVERADRDFLIRVADLVLSGTATTPAKGDRIDLVLADGQTQSHEVMPIGSEPHYAVDPHTKMYRVHTRSRQTL